jgi:hypothetical protein
MGGTASKFVGTFTSTADRHISCTHGSVTTLSEPISVSQLLWNVDVNLLQSR